MSDIEKKRNKKSCDIRTPERACFSGLSKESIMQLMRKLLRVMLTKICYGQVASYCR